MRTFCAVFITLSLLFSCTTPKADSQNQDENQGTDLSLEARLQGSWQSLTDSLYIINFRNDQYFSEYGDVIDPSSQFTIVDSCAGALSKGEYLRVYLPDGTPMCYSLVKLTADELELTYLAKGNTLRFRKR